MLESERKYFFVVISADPRTNSTENNQKLGIIKKKFNQTQTQIKHILHNMLDMTNIEKI